jgi:hypothetical protein
MGWLSQVTAASGYPSGVLGPLLLFGTGIGLCFMPLNLMIIAGVPRGDSGAVSGLLQAMQRAGGAVGVAVLVTAFGIAAGHGAGHPLATAALARGIAAAFTLGTTITAAALVLAAVAIKPL